MTLKFRDGDRYAAIDGGSITITITIALAIAVDHPVPGETVLVSKTADVDGAAVAIAAGGGTILRPAYDDAHERRAVMREGSRELRTAITVRRVAPWNNMDHRFHMWERR